MAEHSDLGPSALHRVLSCPGSFMLSQRPEVKALGNRRSVYAAKGTVAHRVAEGVIAGDAPVMGVTTESGHDIDVDDQMLDAVKVYTELVETFIALSDWHVIEHRVNLDPYWLPNTPPVSVFGTTDFAGYHQTGRVLRVIDYKHGSGVYVAVEDNPQALAYAAGALLICPGDVAEVEITIVQPNAAGNAIRTYKLSVVDLLMWVHEVLMPGIARAQVQQDVFVEGTYCRFCPGVVFCPLMTQAANEAAIKQFGDDTQLTPQGLADYLDQADRAELWITRVRDLAKAAIKQDMEIPGWGLVPTRPVRSWDNADQVLVDLQGLGVSLDTIVDHRVFSPAQLEKRIGPELFRHVARHVQRVSSGTKLERT